MKEILQTLYAMFQEGGNTALLVLSLITVGYLIKDRVTTSKEYRLETLKLLESFRDSLDAKNNQIVVLVERITAAITSNTTTTQQLIRLIERWDIKRSNDV